MTSCCERSPLQSAALTASPKGTPSARAPAFPAHGEGGPRSGGRGPWTDGQQQYLIVGSYKRRSPAHGEGGPRSGGRGPWTDGQQQYLIVGSYKRRSPAHGEGGPRKRWKRSMDGRGRSRDSLQSCVLSKKTSLKPEDAKGAAVWQLLFGGVSVFAVDAPGVDAAFVA